jgi:hypothetical protein
MSSSIKPAEQPFAQAGGVNLPHATEDDPYRVLDDLMVVVEALCPEWPERELFYTSGKMLL